MTRGLVGSVVGAAIAVTSACRAPTQVTVEVIYRGPLPCTTVPQIAITVRASPEDAEGDLSTSVYTAQTASCVSDGEVGRFGTLVVTPGSNRRASIAVVGALTGQSPPVTTSDCTPQKHFAGCIVARRQVSFSDHVSLELPVELDIDCASVSCDVRSTCRAKQCVPSDASCKDDTCEVGGSDGTTTGDGGGDGAVEEDATTPVDASTDAPIGDGSMPPPGSCAGSETGPSNLTCPGTGMPCGNQTCLFNSASMWTCEPGGGGFTTDCFSDVDCKAGYVCCHDDSVSGASCRPATKGACPVTPGVKTYQVCNGSAACPCRVGSCNITMPGFGECR